MLLVAAGGTGEEASRRWSSNFKPRDPAGSTSTLVAVYRLCLPLPSIGIGIRDDEKFARPLVLNVFNTLFIRGFGENLTPGLIYETGPHCADCTGGGQAIVPPHTHTHTHGTLEISCISCWCIVHVRWAGMRLWRLMAWRMKLPFCWPKSSKLSMPKAIFCYVSSLKNWRDMMCTSSIASDPW